MIKVDSATLEDLHFLLKRIGVKVRSFLASLINAVRIRFQRA
jgi:hypothetical protein